MDHKELNKLSFKTIRNDMTFYVEADVEFDEEEMIINIERRVAEMMEKEMDLLLSYLYRLDISENKINACLNPKSPFHPYTCLATLIWERQKERIKTKKQYRQEGSVEEGWEW
jgi:hypothetical protein